MGESLFANPTYWLAFKAVFPPFGFSTYVIASGKSSALIKPISYTLDGSRNGIIQIGPGNSKLIYSGNNGEIAHMPFEIVNISVEQSYSYYAGDDGSTDLVNFQASGVYIFRPIGTYAIPPEGKIPLTVFKGPLYDEVQSMNISVYKEKEHTEVEFIVGPIPIDDKVGKEIVSQIKTNIGNSGTFYTDSNGRDFLERIRDCRADWDLQVNQPIAGNYYPAFIPQGIFFTFIQSDKIKPFSVVRVHFPFYFLFSIQGFFDCDTRSIFSVQDFSHLIGGPERDCSFTNIPNPFISDFFKGLILKNTPG
ncbi:hypothetical protein CASFOL_000814 [Castilleja foliolosa]|uniref:Glycosyl hydrolase family 38 C-terminal domain-containing protein n=1 Tax=Castilleja foliolosa TaxID=1961234 RepID=A0ABD3EKR9_9LAMI